MTQLSSNTIVYDQIIAKVSKFIIDYKQNKFSDNKEFMNEYQNIINFLNTNISRTLNGVGILHQG